MKANHRRSWRNRCGFPDPFHCLRRDPARAGQFFFQEMGKDSVLINMATVQLKNFLNNSRNRSAHRAIGKKVLSSQFQQQQIFISWYPIKIVNHWFETHPPGWMAIIRPDNIRIWTDQSGGALCCELRHLSATPCVWSRIKIQVKLINEANQGCN